MVTLHWIRRDSSAFKTYVSNRVASIQRNSETNRWHHVPTSSNPADIISRGTTPNHLTKCDMWWHVPPFICQTYDQWPNQLPEMTMDEFHASEIEVKRLNARITVRDFKWLSINNQPLIERYSSLGKLVRITAYVMSVRGRLCGNIEAGTLGFSN